MPFIPPTPLPLLRAPRSASLSSRPLHPLHPSPRACLPPFDPHRDPDILLHHPSLSYLHTLRPPSTRTETDTTSPPPGGPSSTISGDDHNDDEPHRHSILQSFSKAEQTQFSEIPLSTLLPYQQATTSALARLLCTLSPGWRRRVLADPNFPFKVLMEETVGLGLAGLGMVAARGSEILNEIDFALCDILVGGTLNFMLVYLLSPVYGGAAAGGANGLAALPTSLFSPGAYTVPARVASFAYKGVLFGACGFAGSLVGTGLTQVLVLARRGVAALQCREYQGKELPDVWKTSAAWAAFMMLSANPRYQSVAGVERALFSYAPPVAAKVGSAVLRTANNVGGGANWVWWAKYIGLQGGGKKEHKHD